MLLGQHKIWYPRLISAKDAPKLQQVLNFLGVKETEQKVLDPFCITFFLYMSLTLPRRGYRFCGSEGGGLLKPPLRNQWRSGLRPHVAIDIMLRCKFRAHMQKFGPLSQKLGEISRFKNLVRLRFHVTLVYKNCHNSLNFRDRSPKFCMWSLNLYLNNMSIATWGLSPLHHWFLRGGFRSPPPPPTHKIHTPPGEGLMAKLKIAWLTCTWD